MSQKENWIGRTVTDAETGETGIVLSPVEGLVGFYMVRVWHEGRRTYVEKMLCSKWFGEPEDVAGVHEKDLLYCEALAEAVMDFSLQTHDREWFDSVKKIGQKQE